MAAKLDKHELNEPDKLQLFFLSMRAFAEKHRTRIYAGGGIFILIALLAGGWYLYRVNYQTSAGKIYNQIFDAAYSFFKRTFSSYGVMDGRRVSVKAY